MHVVHTHTPERESIISPFVKDVYPYFNGIASIAELAIGALSGNVALALDGAHGTVEIPINRLQATDAHLHDTVSANRQRIVRWVLATTFGVGSIVSGGELLGVWSPGVENTIIDSLELVPALASNSSATIATLSLMRRAKQKYEGLFDTKFKLNSNLTGTEIDIVNHIVRLDFPSSSLALGATICSLAAKFSENESLQHFFESTQSTIGLVMGIAGIVFFNPFKQHQHSH